MYTFSILRFLNELFNIKPPLIVISQIKKIRDRQKLKRNLLSIRIENNRV